MLTRHPRLIAGLWFGCAGSLIPVGLAVITPDVGDYTEGGSNILADMAFTILPIAASVIAGLWIGARIVDEERTTSASDAVGFGVLVGCSALVINGFLLAAVGIAGGGGVRETLLGALMLLFYSFVFVGVAAALLGALAGWGLFRMMHRRQRRTAKPA